MTAWGTTLVEECSLPGAPATEWRIEGAGSTEVQGFATQFSMNSGGVIKFAIDGPTCTVVDIYRIGGYNTGWRKVGTVRNTPIEQKAPEVIPGSNGANTCVGWQVTANWEIPGQALSGLYVAVPRDGSGGMSWIPFVVRNDARAADIVVKTSELTWYAHNFYGSRHIPFGGKSLNGASGKFSVAERAFAVTLDRPLVTREYNEESYWLNSEAPLIRFLEKQGIDYKMVASADLDSPGGLSTVGAAKILMSSGHDAYWTQGMRDNVEAFRDTGRHLVFMSASTSLWRARLSGDRRTVWCYKDTLNHGVPMDPVTWTGAWRDKRWAQCAPESLLTGTELRMSGPQDRTALINTASYRKSPFWRDTPVELGTSLSLREVIGFVADAVAPTQEHAIQIAGTVLNINGAYVDDNAEYYSSTGNLNWGIVLQRYSSGAVVAGFGTAQWQWALDDDHDGGNVRSDQSVQQATLNLLRDMGVKASRPTSRLVAPMRVTWEDYGLAARESTPIAPGTYEIMVSDGTQWYPAGGGGAPVPPGPEHTIPFTLTNRPDTLVIDLGYIPVIVIVDSAGDVVEPGSIECDGTTVTLGFSAPFSGTAYCFA